MLNKIEKHFAFGQIFQLKDLWLEATCCIALLDAIFYQAVEITIDAGCGMWGEDEKQYVFYTNK